MITSKELSARLDEVRGRIVEATSRSGRQGEAVRVIGITKGWPVEVVQTALDIGLTDIGENRVQEAEEKAWALNPGVRFHLVGHLQRNKTGKAATLFDTIHSVDSTKLAVALNRAAKEARRSLEVLVQVNTAHDPAKYGICVAEAARLMADLEHLDGIRVVGLMTIGPFTEDPEESRPHFRALRNLRDRLRAAYPNLLHLSMGMSADYEVAVEEGATMVRIGTVLFGVRAR